MRSLFRNLFLVGLLATTVACGDDNDNDDDGNQAGNPVENPVATPGPSPTPGTTPAPFEWSTARLEEREDAGGGCSAYWRFTVRTDGSFTSRDACDPTQNKSGDLSAADQTRLDQAMDAISRAEASSRLRCTTFDDGTNRPDQRLSMTIRNGRRFALYTQKGNRECVSGTATEVASLRNLLYEFRAIYADPSIRL